LRSVFDYIDAQPPSNWGMIMNARQVVLCNPVRTPIGTYGGALKNTPATALGAIVIREVLKRSGLAPEKVQALVMGQVIQAGSKMNPARQAGIGGAGGRQVRHGNCCDRGQGPQGVRTFRERRAQPVRDHG
jgi:hypothetical protein